MKFEKESFVVSRHGIRFYITENDSVPRFGITSVMENDPEDKSSSQGIFFTQEEAVKCCEWLADNEVYPITLTDVLANLRA